MDAINYLTEHAGIFFGCSITVVLVLLACLSVVKDKDRKR